MSKQEVKTVDIHFLENKMASQPDLFLIDVREQDEWQEAHIPGVLHIPKDQIASSIAQLVSDKNQAIYLHCRSGVRSLYAAQVLMDLGYTNVYSVDGGIVEWAMFGYPVQSECSVLAT